MGVREEANNWDRSDRQEESEEAVKQFVFAGNRRRWRRLRPLVGIAALGGGLWLAALCWTLLKTPALLPLPLRAHPAAVPARQQTTLARRPPISLRQARQ
jgi:hypothetical protein